MPVGARGGGGNALYVVVVTVWSSGCAARFLVPVRVSVAVGVAVAVMVSGVHVVHAVLQVGVYVRVIAAVVAVADDARARVGERKGEQCQTDRRDGEPRSSDHRIASAPTLALAGEWNLQFGRRESRTFTTKTLARPGPQPNVD
jgi:hypothetical protein